jgi:sugar phosphate isomerase/epimerase
MKLAFSSLACPDWKWSTVIDKAAELGYDGVEWRLINGETVGPGYPEKVLKEIRDYALEKGIGVCALDSSVKLTHADDHDRHSAVTQAQEMLELTQAIGAGIMRVFPGVYPEEVSDEQAVEALAQALEELEPAARKTGVTVALELHDSFPWNRTAKRGTTTSQIVRRALTRANASHASVLWDLGNPHMEGEDIRATWQNIQQLPIGLVHTKDMVPDGDGFRYVLTGQGMIDLPLVVQRLQDVSYNGWISYEWEKKWHPDLAEPDTALPHFLGYIREKDLLR